MIKTDYQVDLQGAMHQTRRFGDCDGAALLLRYLLKCIDDNPWTSSHAQTGHQMAKQLI